MSAINAQDDSRVRVWGKVFGDTNVLATNQTAHIEVHGDIEASIGVCVASLGPSKIVVHGDLIAPTLTQAINCNLGSAEIHGNSIGFVAIQDGSLDLYGDIISDDPGSDALSLNGGEAKIFGDITSAKNGIFVAVNGLRVKVVGNVSAPAGSGVVMDGGDVEIAGDISSGAGSTTITQTGGTFRLRGNISSDGVCVDAANSVLYVEGNIQTSSLAAAAVSLSNVSGSIEGDILAVNPDAAVVLVSGAMMGFEISGSIKKTPAVPSTIGVVQVTAGGLRLSNVYISDSNDAAGIPIVTNAAGAVMYFRSAVISGLTASGDSLDATGLPTYVFETPGGSNLAAQVGAVIVGVLLVDPAIL